MARHRYTSAAGLALVLVALTAGTRPGDAAAVVPDPSAPALVTGAKAPQRDTAVSCAGRQSLPPAAIAARQRRCPGVVPTSSLAGTTGSVDLRSPDARDAARAAGTTGSIDLRSPDARDAARAAGIGRQGRTPEDRVPVARFAALDRPAARSDSSGGTTGIEIAIVGGGAAGFLLFASWALLGTRRHEAARKDRALVLH